MNPQEFNWTADQRVVVTNPTSKDFRFQVHSKWYEVPAGKTVEMPGFIAWSYVHKLAIVMAVAAEEFNEEWNDTNVRQRYYDKLVVRVKEVIQNVVEEDQSSVTTFDSDTDDDLDSDPLGDDEEETNEQQEGEPKIAPMKAKRGRPSKK